MREQCSNYVAKLRMRKLVTGLLQIGPEVILLQKKGLEYKDDQHF
jgi:hypothetical protein